MSEANQLPKIRVLSIGTIQELVGVIQPRNRLFTLFLAWDAPEVKSEQLESWLRPLVEHGLGYFCAWGDRCEEVHDAVDRCDIALLKDDPRPDNIVMTTWHSKQSLDEAFDFFIYCADLSVTTNTKEFDRFAVVIGNPHWAGELQGILLKLSAE